MLVTICLLFCSNSFAARGYVGQNPVKGVHIIGASVSCGPSNGSCLLIVFEGGALGCSPASGSISIPLDAANFELIQSMALVSLTSKKKFRAYATIESCGDADTINLNSAGVYE